VRVVKQADKTDADQRALAVSSERFEEASACMGLMWSSR
jgi:hypothetical protein